LFFQKKFVIKYIDKTSIKLLDEKLSSTWRVVMDKERSIYLLEEIAEGSESSFNEFYNRYVSFVLHIATKTLGDRVEAEDVTHDIFLEIYQKPTNYRPDRGSVKAWIAVMTRNRCIDRLRKKKPILVNKLELLETKEAVKTELSVLMRLEQELIIEALKEIPQKQREVIYGAYFEGKTQVELAKTLNRPLGTIKSLVRYGLKNMQKNKRLLNWIKAR